MPLDRRSTQRLSIARRLLIALFAVPVIVTVYLAVAGNRIVAATRTALATTLGMGVIGAVYVDEAWHRAPAPTRRIAPAALAAALAISLVGAGLPAAQVQAASPAESMVKAALKHLDKPYVWGATGPNAFDCSGLVFRAFRDAGELPLIGGSRRTAAWYYKFFATRGLTSKTKGKRGDLVVYGGGTHIGIYLGKGKVLSAITTGVKIHGLHALRSGFTTFLNVAWGSGGSTSGSSSSSGGSSSGGSRSGGSRSSSDNNSSSGSGTNDNNDGDATVAAADESGTDSTPAATSASLPKGFAFGSLNMRRGPGPKERIISWVTRGSTVTILETGRSPSGALWLRVEKSNGKQGWIWARWVRVVEGSLDDLN